MAPTGSSLGCSRLKLIKKSTPQRSSKSSIQSSRTSPLMRMKNLEAHLCGDANFEGTERVSKAQDNELANIFEEAFNISTPSYRGQVPPPAVPAVLAWGNHQRLGADFGHQQRAETNGPCTSALSSTYAGEAIIFSEPRQPFRRISAWSTP